MAKFSIAAHGQDSIDTQGKFLRVVSMTGVVEILVEGRIDGTEITDKIRIDRAGDQYEFGGVMRRVTVRDMSGAGNDIEISVGWGKYFAGLDGTEVNVTAIVPVDVGSIVPIDIASSVPIDIATMPSLSVGAMPNLTIDAMPDAAGLLRTRIISAASTNSTLVLAAPGRVHAINGTNGSGTDRYLKLYDQITAPVVGTDIPVETYLLPAGSAWSFNFGDRGVLFADGIAYAITALLPDADTTAIGAGDVVAQLHYTD